MACLQKYSTKTKRKKRRAENKQYNELITLLYVSGEF